MHFKQFQGLLDQVTEIVSLSLTVVNFVAQVAIACLEQVHDWQDLSVVWYQCLSDGVGAGDECLQDFQGDRNDLWVTSVQCRLYWDNKLWDDWKHLGTALFEHIEYTLHGQESVWIHFLSDTLEEDWQVMMVIELLDLDLPVDLVLWRVMLNCHWQVAAIVEETELAHWDLSSTSSTGNWLLYSWSLLWHVQTNALAAEAITLFQNSGTSGRDRNLLFLDWLDIGNACLFTLHPVFWEITEGRVLSTWQVFIVVWLPLVAGCHGQAFLEMILEDHLSCWCHSTDTISWLHVRHI